MVYPSSLSSATRLYRSQTTEKHFQNIFEIESMLQNSVNFFFLAPAAKSNAGKLEVCNVLIESV